MQKYRHIPLILLVAALLSFSATISKAQMIFYECGTVVNDPFEGIILEWDTVPSTMPSAVGLAYVILEPGEEMTFTVTQVSGGPTPVFMQQQQPLGATLVRGIASTVFTFLATEYSDYDFLIGVGADSTGQVRVNWSCGPAADGHIHDGRLNSGDLGTLAVVYPQETQIDVYAVNPETSEGWMVIRVLVDDLPPFDQVRTEPLLLGEAASPFDGRPVALYLLPSNEFLIAAENPDGTPYRFLWPRTA
jgi:hypothetical protein